MRYNSREKCIEAKEIEIPLSHDGWVCAVQVGDYLTTGIAREIERELGIEIEGAKNVRHWFDLSIGKHIVRVYDEWVRPTRR